VTWGPCTDGSSTPSVGRRRDKANAATLCHAWRGGRSHPPARHECDRRWMQPCSTAPVDAAKIRRAGDTTAPAFHGRQAPALPPCQRGTPMQPAEIKDMAAGAPNRAVAEEREVSTDLRHHPPPRARHHHPPHAPKEREEEARRCRPVPSSMSSPDRPPTPPPLESTVGARRRMDQGRTGEGARIVVGVRTSLALPHHAAALTSLSAPDPTMRQLDSEGERAERPRKGETEREEGEGEGWGARDKVKRPGFPRTEPRILAPRW
jgi:hypothetical protein